MELLSNLEHFSMVMKVKLGEDNKGKVKTILGHSGCGCWALTLNSAG